MPATNEVIDCYGELASRLSLMAQLARDKEWGRLPELETQCAAVTARLKAIGPTDPLEPKQLEEAQRLMRQIRADHEEVSRLVRPQLERLMAAMAHLQKQKCLDKAYGPSP